MSEHPDKGTMSVEEALELADARDLTMPDAEVVYLPVDFAVVVLAAEVRRLQEDEA